MDADLAAIMGARIRRERLAFRRRQADIADAADVSQSTISRMELGHGGAIPLDTWRRVSAVLEIDLDIIFLPRGAPTRDAIQGRCHGLVVDRALVGGWGARTVMDRHDPALSETVLERSDRREVAIVRVWDVTGCLEPRSATSSAGWITSDPCGTTSGT